VLIEAALPEPQGAEHCREGDYGISTAANAMAMGSNPSPISPKL